MPFFGHTTRMPCLSKMRFKENMSADEADLKQQEIKELGSVSFNFLYNK